jgi:hypothetical protein
MSRCELAKFRAWGQTPVNMLIGVLGCVKGVERLDLLWNF